MIAKANTVQYPVSKSVKKLAKKIAKTSKTTKDQQNSS